MSNSDKTQDGATQSTVVFCGAWDDGDGYPRTDALRQGLEAARLAEDAPCHDVAVDEAAYGPAARARFPRQPRRTDDVSESETAPARGDEVDREAARHARGDHVWRRGRKGRRPSAGSARQERSSLSTSAGALWARPSARKPVWTRSIVSCMSSGSQQ